jgi:hypothetical protein
MRHHYPKLDDRRRASSLTDPRSLAMFGVGAVAGMIGALGTAVAYIGGV